MGELRLAGAWVVCAAVGSWSLLHLLTEVRGWSATVAGVAVALVLVLAAAATVGVVMLGEPWRGRAHTGVVAALASWALGAVLVVAIWFGVTVETLTVLLLVVMPLCVLGASAAVLRSAQLVLAGRRTRHVLYHFRDVDGELLYIGITNSPRDRFAQHAEDKDWWHQVAWVEMTYWPSRAALEATERYQIRRLGTRHNIVHNGRRGAVERFRQAAAR